MTTLNKNMRPTEVRSLTSNGVSEGVMTPRKIAVAYVLACAIGMVDLRSTLLNDSAAVGALVSKGKKNTPPLIHDSVVLYKSGSQASVRLVLSCGRFVYGCHRSSEVLRGLSRERKICVWGPWKQRGPERPVPGAEDLCVGAIGSSEVLRGLSRERKICVWGPWKQRGPERPVPGAEDMCMAAIGEDEEEENKRTRRRRDTCLKSNNPT